MTLVLTGPSASAGAQTVGVRAQGMAGAFTGVADDASAVYWNPAGLASGAYFSGVVDFNSLASSSQSPNHHTSSATLVSLGMPPLAFGYYRTRSEPAAGVDRLVAHHFGVTLDQSLWGGLAVGATLQAVHGLVDDEFSSTKFDLNVGVMESGRMGQLGLTIRDVLQPTFGAGGVTARLPRQVRIGGSVNLTDETLIAADADLTKTDTTGVDRQDAAIGVEQHLSAKATIRGGVHWNLRRAAGPAEVVDVGLSPEGSVGASYAVYGRTSVDAQVTFGSRNGDRGWGVGLRMAF